jgi:hypothetical protein
MQCIMMLLLRELAPATLTAPSDVVLHVVVGASAYLETMGLWRWAVYLAARAGVPFASPAAAGSADPSREPFDSIVRELVCRHIDVATDADEEV